MENIQSVRGTKDLFGEEFTKFNYIIELAKKLADLYQYQGINVPIFEFSQVFSRSLGESSDVVSKEMYSFLDKKNRSITLRPELTAGICRAFISNGLTQFLPLKLFSFGPLFRYENPQKGRQRQFHQLDFEYLANASPTIDAEVIAMAAHLLEKLGVLKNTTLELNSLGCFETRKKFQQALVDYLETYREQLSSDSKARLEKNPLRILDSKDKSDQKIILNAPKISQYFTTEAEDFFESLKQNLTLLKINFKINPNLVRGLDYYNHTAFEFITNDLGAQGTVLGGGRYNGLIKLLGGDDTQGIGFAAGIERLMLLVDLPIKTSRPIMVLASEEKFASAALKLAHELRLADFTVNFSHQTKFDKAFKNGISDNCSFALIVEGELVTLRDLDQRHEEKFPISDIIDKMKKL